MTSIGRIPEATVARLPLYLRGLDAFPVGVAATVSSDELADLAGVNAAKVRKDLSYLGTYGTRGVGYDADFLRFEISRALGVANTWPVVVCGMGNLVGRALGVDELLELSPVGLLELLTQDRIPVRLHRRRP